MGHPFQGQFVLGGLGLATINLRTKFEISTFTHYKYMTGDKNAKIWVVWGLGVTQGHQQHNHSTDTTSYSTLIETMLYLVRFSSTSELFVESGQF